MVRELEADTATYTTAVDWVALPCSAPNIQDRSAQKFFPGCLGEHVHIGNGTVPVLVKWVGWHWDSVLYSLRYHLV